jgi:DNA-binding beta-propeller fold protein YncE
MAWAQCRYIGCVARVLFLNSCVILAPIFVVARAQADGASRIEGVFVREIQQPWNGVAISPDGQFVAVSDSLTKSVQVLRACDQSLVRSIGQGTLQDARRLAFSPDSATVFVSDIELHAVLQYRMDGTLVRQIGSKGASAGKFDEPRGLVVSKAGRLFVSDRGNHRVQVFEVSNGTFLRKFGAAQGSGDGQFNMPMDVALSPDEEELLVVDSGNNRIQVFRARDSQYVRRWGSCGSVGGQFSGPLSVVVTGSGEVLVADMLNHRICVFALNGTFRRSIGSQGHGPGQFEQPFFLAVSPTSCEMCVGQISGRVQFFR